MIISDRIETPSDKLRVRTIQASLLVGLSLCTAAAHAQSSVTLYGLISIGVGYTSNQDGKSLYSMISGPEQLPRWGIKGKEYLGGGTSALFTLENGFSITNGSASQGGRMFGRQAYVGLSNASLGTLTLGRQYDELSQQLYWSESAAQFAAFGTHVGDNDNIFDTVRFNNSVRYTVEPITGLTLASQYAFSNSTNGFIDNSGFSFGASYINGRLKLGAAMAQYNEPASLDNPQGAVDNASYGFTSPFVQSPGGSAVARQRISAAGVSYDFGIVQATLGYSNVLFDYLDSTGLRLQNLEGTLMHQFTSALLAGVSYAYSFGRYSAGPEPRYAQINVGGVYSLSKRTDLFLVSIYQKAGGAATHAQIFSTSPSSSTSEFLVTTGMRLRF
jgi:GBP family porin